MKWLRLCSTVVVVLGLTTAAHAGFGLFGGHGAEKSCGCAPTMQPQSCAPTIQRPCGFKIFSYQRQIACQKPPCAQQGCAPGVCAPAQPCRKSTRCCLTGGKSLFSIFRKKDCCAEQPVCAAPASPACGTMKNPGGLLSCLRLGKKQHCGAQPACAVPCNQPNCQPKKCFSLFDCFRGLKKSSCGAQPACAVPAQPACAAPCNQPCCEGKKKCLLSGLGGLFSCTHRAGHGEQGCRTVDPCELATLIYVSQTACQPKHRQRAVNKLGKHDCVCYPEVVCALVYALNDADPDVRAEAADELGDMVRRNPHCCRPEVTSALACALADCDKGVRKQAEEGLEQCGYMVVDAGCGPNGCTSGCVTASGQPNTVPAPTTAPVPVPPTSVAPPVPPAPLPPAQDGSDIAPPAPPAEPQAYFPSRLGQYQQAATTR